MLARLLKVRHLRLQDLKQLVVKLKAHLRKLLKLQVVHPSRLQDLKVLVNLKVLVDLKLKDQKLLESLVKWLDQKVMLQVEKVEETVRKGLALVLKVALKQQECQSKWLAPKDTLQVQRAPDPKKGRHLKAHRAKVEQEERVLAQKPLDHKQPLALKDKAPQKMDSSARKKPKRAILKEEKSLFKGLKEMPLLQLGPKEAENQLEHQEIRSSNRWTLVWSRQMATKAVQ